jgi:hypothetical protein
MADIVLFATDAFDLLGVDSGTDTPQVRKLVLRKQGGGIEAQFSFLKDEARNMDYKIDIPNELLTPKTENPRRFIPLSAALPEVVVALRERLRNQLSQELPLQFDATDFFKAKSLFGASLTGSVRLNLPWLEGAAVTVFMTAQANARVDVAVGRATFKATARLSVEVRKDAVEGLIDWLNPDWPAFDIAWPKVDLSGLSWVNLTADLPNIFPAFALPRLPFLEGSDFVWDTAKPKLLITVDGNGALSFTTDAPRDGKLMLNGKEALTLKSFQVTSAGAGIKIAGTVSKKDEIKIHPPEIDDKRLPFTVKISTIDVIIDDVVKLAEPKASLEFAVNIDRIEIRSKKDPSLFLVLKAKVNIVVTYPGGVKTTLTELKAVEPYPIVFVVDKVKIGRLLRIRLPFKPSTNEDSLPLFLKRVADMLKSAAIWLGEQAGHVAQSLAGIAESGFELLKSAIDTLITSAQAADQLITVELRLDPRTYRLRQILLSLHDFPGSKFQVSILGFSITADADLKPCLLVDLGEPWWVGLGLVNRDGTHPTVSLGTDLWLARATSAAQPLKGLKENSGAKGDPLLRLSAQLNMNCALVPLAFRAGRIELFQKSEYLKGTDLKGTDVGEITIGDSGVLEALGPGDVDLTLDASALKERLVNLLSKPKPSNGGSFGKAFETYITIRVKDNNSGKFKIDLSKPTVAIPLILTIHFNADKEFSAEAEATLVVSLNDLTARLDRADRISIRRTEPVENDILGLNLKIQRKDGKDDPFEAFVLDLKGGKEEFGLGSDAKATLTLRGVANTGKGLQFGIDNFSIGRDGLNLGATTIDDPVMLGGVNMPFRFHSGRLDIVNSKLTGATIAGSGQLPPALIGEATVSISLRLAERSGSVVVESAEAKLDKGDEPIVCESTRLRVSISKLEMSYEQEGNGQYHFYFLITGKARFQPREGEFGSGLLKHLKELELVLDRAPLTGDGSLLMHRINFQAKVDPPKRSSFFDLFEFELRGIGFHPAADAFDGNPAISISGQVKFTDFADKVQPHFRFHELWIAPPEPGKFLPRVRFDGLTVGLDLGGMAEVEGTAIAVDDKLPTIYKPSVLPAANISANGFLASGRLSIKGWASMSAAMGFLELRERSGSEPKLAFFFYLQQNKLSIPIPTPVGEIHLREVGYGFGWRYTLTGIAETETVSSPKELVQILDQVSKYQGSLDDLTAWEPTYASATLTLAMRAMFSISSASDTAEYNEAEEKDLANPLLFDVVAAIRSDLTFLMSIRAWLCVNYADWINPSFGGRTKPSLRGYLYLSVPKKTFLGRFISTSDAVIGKHPELPEQLRLALENVKFTYTSTLFITPGLFHFELGWPYELRVEIGKPNGNFYLSCSGGMIFRIEDGAMLYGYALKAVGFAQIGANTGGSFGAAAFARADFSIEGKLLSYLSTRAPGETMFYGYFRFDVYVSVSVRVWLEFSVFGGTVHLEIGFNLGLTLAMGVELALLVNQGLGVRAYTSVMIKAFGRTLSLGVTLQVGGNVLDTARARVDRFLSLGLGTSIPETASIGRPPVVEPNRAMRAAGGDKRIEDSAQKIPQAPLVQNDASLTAEPGYGQAIKGADFWAMLFPVKVRGGDSYVVQLIPRDLTNAAQEGGDITGAFYAPVRHKIEIPAGLAIKKFEWDPETAKVTAEDIKRPESSISTRRLGTGQDKPTVTDIWNECFFFWKVQKKFHYKDPIEVHWTQANLSADTDTAARELEMAGRSRLAQSGPEIRTSILAERRSAMIGIIANSALQLAQAGESNGKWYEPPIDQLNCLDTGLTFLIDLTALKKLFPGMDGERLVESKDFKVNRIDDSDNTTTDGGKVFLFNPPNRMFVNAQPRLTEFQMEARPDGIAMKWDLEPEWTRSKDVYDDPEFHLRHYKIERYVDHLDESWKYSFDVKAAAPIDHENKCFFKPPLQFLDSLTQPKNLPEKLRNVILRKYDNLDDWPKEYQEKDIVVRYRIYAIDCAGTSDFGTPQDFHVWKPPSCAKGPSSASMKFVFEGENLGNLTGPVVSAILNYTLKENQKLPDSPAYEIAVLERLPIPNGQYGADSLSSALEEISTRIIEKEAAKFPVKFTGTKTLLGCKLKPNIGQGTTGWLQFSPEQEDTFASLIQTAGRSLLFFIREKSTIKDGSPSHWQKCTVEIRIGKAGSEPRVDAVLEEYERPIDLKFQPITRQDFTEVEQGRVYFLEPKEDAAVGQWAEFVVPVLDRKRRAGIRLRWKARPNELRLASGPNTIDFWRLVGGFHLFDVTHFDSSDKIPPPPIAVALLPQSAQGLEPSEMGDLSLIETAYPSNATKSKYSSWFSAAESSPLFPDPSVFRRSLMISVDEGLLASLFEKGRPNRLGVSIIGADGKPSPVLLKFPLDEFVRHQVQVKSPPDESVTYKEWWTGQQDEDPLKPQQVRTFLQSAVLLQELADGTKVTITAMNNDSALVSKEFLFEASPKLHPVLADTLDLIRYANNSESDGDPGSVHRRYEVVFDPSPSRTTNQFEGWMDSTPEQRDPYGWSILRTLGLAAGFRIYDTQSGIFLAGEELTKLVGKTFQNAINRYEGSELGVPFLDLLTAPMRTARAFSFDGSGESRADEGAYILEEQLSVIQIALRPRISSLVNPPNGGKKSLPYQTVFYFAAVVPESDKPLDYTLKLAPDKEKFDIDLIASSHRQLAATRVSLSPVSSPPQLEATLKLGSLRDKSQSILVRLVCRDNASFVDLKDVLHSRLKFESKTLQEIEASLPALDSQAWARQFFGSDFKGKLDAPQHEPLSRLQIWAQRSKLTWPADDSTSQKAQELKRTTLAGKIVAWWKRFLDHGLGIQSDWVWPRNGPVHVSVGTIGKPGTWRMAEESDGSVGVFLTEDSEYGNIKRFVVRPYSRYDAFAKALNDPKVRVTPLDWKQAHLVDITLPRTAPVAKPTILSAALVREEKKPDVLELVVARTPDEIISSANRTTALALASDGISIGFWREFAAPQWGGALLGLDYKPGAAMGKTESLPPKGLTLTDDAWLGVRKRVPDAWLGAWVYRMQALPYFYRIHALVHASAGVAVSDPSAATFVNGVSKLPGAPKATYRVTNNRGTVHVAFTIPLVAFRDCMVNETYWNNAAEYERLSLLPDPGIAYRITLESTAEGDYFTNAGNTKVKEVLSCDSQFEIAASLGTAKEHYLVQPVGERITLPASTEPTRLEAAPAGDNRWQITVDGILKTVAGEFSSAVPWECLKETVVSVGDFPLWRRVAPTGSATLDYSQPTSEAEKTALTEYCNKQIESLGKYFQNEAPHSSITVLQTILGFPDSQTFKLPDWILGLPRPAQAKLTFKLGTDLNWNRTARGSIEERNCVTKIMTGECTDNAVLLNKDLWRHFVKTHSAMVTKEVEETVFTSAEIRGESPFDVMQVLVVKSRMGTYSAAKLSTLRAELEHSIAGGSTLEALDPDRADNLDPTEIPWPASAKVSRELLNELFEFDIQARAYFLVAVRMPVSEDLATLAETAFSTSAAAMAEDMWFGSKRRPRLDTVRGTEAPVSKEIIRR